MNLTTPEHYWCPRCQVHLRSMDVYGDSGRHEMRPLCPVCQDDDDRVADAMLAAAIADGLGDPTERWTS